MAYHHFLSRCTKYFSDWFIPLWSIPVRSVIAGIISFGFFFKERLEHREVKPHITGSQCSLLEKPKLDPDIPNHWATSAYQPTDPSQSLGALWAGKELHQGAEERKGKTIPASLESIYIHQSFMVKSFCKKSQNTHKKIIQKEASREKNARKSSPVVKNKMACVSMGLLSTC